jgi:hypothetical protein
MTVRDWPQALCTISDGILIPLGAFQCCMPDLYDLEGALQALNEAAKYIDPEEIERYFSEGRDV